MPVPSRPGTHFSTLSTPFFRPQPCSPPLRYQAHYGVDLGKQVAKKDGAAPVVAADVKKSKSVLKKAVAVKARGETRVIDKVPPRAALCCGFCFVLGVSR